MEKFARSRRSPRLQLGRGRGAMDGAAGAAKLDEGAGLGEYVGFEDVSYGTLADFDSKDEAELRQMTSAESGWLSELRPPLPHAAVDASEPVVAPSQPWSGASRSLPRRLGYQH